MTSYYAMLMQQSGSGGGLMMWLPFIFIFAIFYFLMIMPQQKRQKKWQQMLSNLKNGDKITTSGGLRGTIIALRDDSVHLRVPPDNIKVEVTRSSIVSVAQDEVIKSQ
ncbi:MAG TPA: preprotein translocase subunit YajC [Clostridia bacterium]|nr:preprotein translocase subunit YajC [Clostridia bacterium]